MMTSTLLMFSFCYMFISKHPFVLGFLVIIQSIMFSLMINLNFMISWFSFLVFMIYLGGILMLFCYMISLMNSKEPFFLKKKMMFYLPMLTIFWMMKEDSFLKTSKMEIKNLLISIYSKSMMTSVFMMILLLVMMIFVILISESSKGSMRSS
uniref:NADH dehydrogenase subunit 6 n=1 Tax=Megalurothrips usitatus TaxID=439358 RepID=UPI0022FD66FC|nr:NADH dehydrogenase subunit 6 [Megalurothrips usitatus]WAT94220.1 NADH dehydrogenase subunit 6 [Megalurothrips usitatus]